MFPAQKGIFGSLIDIKCVVSAYIFLLLILCLICDI